MKILIADDHDLVRETIAAFLMSEDEACVVTVGTLPEALNQVQQNEPFDLVLLDYDMPGMNGLIGLRQMITTAQASPVALISGTAPRALAEKAIMEGAAGFIPKTLSCRSMLSAARFMAAGEIYAPFNFMREPQDGSTEALSKRERDVLHGICRGQSNKEISHECKIHETTVKLHAKTLCRKLGARNRTHAAVIARDFNII